MWLQSEIGNEKPFIKENNMTYPCNAFQFGIAGQRRLGLLFVISKRYPRNHVIHVRVFNIDSLTVEDLDTLLYIYSLEQASIYSGNSAWFSTV